MTAFGRGTNFIDYGTTVVVSNTSYQKEFLLFSFLRSVHSKFWEISIETFIKIFLVLEFFLPSKLQHM